VTTLAWVGAPLVVALVFGGGYWLGRRSAVERAMDRLQRRELYLPPVVRDSLAADKGEATS